MKRIVVAAKFTAGLTVAGLALAGCGEQRDPMTPAEPQPAAVGDTVSTCSKESCLGEMVLDEVSNGGECFNGKLITGNPSGMYFIQFRGTLDPGGNEYYRTGQIEPPRAYDAAGNELRVVEFHECLPDAPYVTDQPNVLKGETVKLTGAYFVPATAVTFRLGNGMIPIADLPPAPGEPILPGEPVISRHPGSSESFEPEVLDEEILYCGQYTVDGFCNYVSGNFGFTQNCYDRQVARYGS